MIACRTPITQVSTPIEQHQSHGFPSGRLRETWLKKHKLSHLQTLSATVLMNPGLSSSGQRIRFTVCQQICLGINKCSHPNTAITKIKHERRIMQNHIVEAQRRVSYRLRKDYNSDLLTVYEMWHWNIWWGRPETRLVLFQIRVQMIPYWDLYKSVQVDMQTLVFVQLLISIFSFHQVIKYTRTCVRTWSYC